jgi:hypothetical protein
VFHHHDSQISVVLCAENQEHHCHDTENTNNCCAIENCFLNNLFTKADDFKIIKPILNNFDIITNDFPVYLISQITDLNGLPFRQKPYIFLFYTDFVSQSAGLRAPPVC